MPAPESKKINYFQSALLQWAAEHPRIMPWKGEADPYKIWLSEIILQQTRVEQGIPYYIRLLQQYPSVAALANSDQDSLMKNWEGLGYYSRARNLHAAAKIILGHHQGVFPKTYSEIRALPGIGDYTAAAIATFAYNLPYAVVDGNVYRVLSRICNAHTPIDSATGKKQFAALANDFLNLKKPAEHNQAIMDFGATLCTAANPKCPICPMQTICSGFQLQSVSQLPVRKKSNTKKRRFFVFLVCRWDNLTLIQKRIHVDIWKNLYQFPLIELASLPANNNEALDLITQHFFSSLDPKNITSWEISKKYEQTLSHQLVSSQFITLYLSAQQDELEKSDLFKTDYSIQPWESLTLYFAFPRLIHRFLSDH
jgi:A/G-specific adenine glycosylase